MVDFIRNLFGFPEGEGANSGQREIKSGFDSSGMPYIDLEDRDTALIIKKKLEAFEGIKIKK